MTTSSTNLTRQKGLLSMVHGLWERWMTYQAQQVTIRELSKLSNRELMDIGLERGDIENIARDSEQTRF